MTYKVYIRFRKPGPDVTKADKSRNRRRKKIVQTILFFIPNANPDHDSLIDDVEFWLLEIDSSDKLPLREIAIDKTGKTLFILPWGRNLGLWTDQDITLEYFMDNFHPIYINKNEFEKSWNEFAEKNH